MAFPSTILKPLICNNCRQWALRTFIASIGGPSLQYRTPVQRRAISQTSLRPNEARERIQQDGHAFNESNDDSRNSQSALDSLLETSQAQSQPPQPTNEQPTTPWYLQPAHQPPKPQQHRAVEGESPLAARQRLPDLPLHPPRLLDPLIRNISIDQGMDDLTLLDLRAIDPPPALGANLIMLLGTARSEKHLHVSADRLCRFLRTQYKINPIADGLLGRNELKLKLRRRAKRTRLMSGGVGAGTADTDLEEGIRTGWVCVNLGRVEGGELPEHRIERERRQREIVGFGAQETGCSVVVQLMTEEKRGEVDLERLWMGMLNGARREKQGAESGESEVEGEIRVGTEPAAVLQELEPVAFASGVGPVQRDVGL
ncbi:ATPase synthesis protein 25 mitochondrial [Friedmanniomyces endolithicus]|uniref:ATPase synthesis protein 25 n=1 Tax=Friedmanniomyces endolithicus TaxID=329885 RepID=A0AAN6KD62_9PEZI|nr:ATPase synthesis protein 25 mitochondrial [Friedmanniomyces endolithicus]KAK0789436.1 ATPase synthesis protein 25 mitochondrial [Friedmanniomyces endolithicus]KAK0796699.1 ATPase synthesis protein 25 mitochondrial [Friedmanniomyces endolithicus]KAK0804270.1 ATPase synthesis protein 25 mitochondrial [Friedmanniomyces endolithicus]KAK0837795.1 ATPase synthesis protein 25 mitochondrial [Friedmanniomyces endolithicus]